MNRNDTLATLRDEKKFARTPIYTGPATEEDRAVMEGEVSSAINDIIKISANDAAALRARLAKLLENVDLLDTEDREEVFVYVVLIWRAAGGEGETGFFESDDLVLRMRGR
ncbi:MAG: hypothetical protein RIC52_18365 [Amphiplicatus sp.]